MTTLLRNPPSGPEAASDIGQTTSQVTNDSAVAGATMTGALDTLSGRLDTLETILLFEEFLGGGDSSAAASDPGRFGELGWSFFASGGSPTLFRPTDNANYFGAYGILASASQISTLTLGNSVSPTTAQVGISNQRYTFAEFVGIPDIGDSAGAFGAYRFGLGSTSLITTGLGDNSLRVEVDRAISNNWRFVTRISTIDTAILSSIPYVPHALTRLRLERNATTGSWTASINGVSIGTFTSAQVANSQESPAIQVQATAASAQSMSIDRLSMGFTVTT